MEPLSRQQALDQVLERRERERRRPPVVRGALALAGVVLFTLSVPLIVFLPELGVPALLLALRLLATEFDWAARAYAWLTWRWGRFRAWFAARPVAVRWLIIGTAVAVAAALVWLIVAH